MIKLSSGPVHVSTADGYRLMIYRKSSSPLVNLKIERSAEGRFAEDRRSIIDQMKEIAAGTKPPDQIDLETSTQKGIELLAINNRDTDNVSGVISMYTLLDAANGNVATVYLLNQRPEVREYASNRNMQNYATDSLACSATVWRALNRIARQAANDGAMSI